jgi:NAD(P)-dependent dehydrogenase (short-subunit alcohol dehydrogenase family)
LFEYTVYGNLIALYTVWFAGVVRGGSMGRSLEGKVAVVAGGTRGAGRGISVELGAAGATVYVTGRSSRVGLSPIGRPETIEETAEMVEAQGGRGIAVRVDHSEPEQVEKFFERVKEEQSGQLDILVNDIWGGESLMQFDTPFWELSLADGFTMLRQGIETHIITSHYAAPLMVRRKSGLILEITDGVGAGYRGSLFYDLVKTSVIRLALAQAVELRQHRVAALALTPGFLRSEEMLDHFGVSEETWRDAIQKDPHFAASETPSFIGRAVVALAADPDVLSRTGGAVSTWQLAKEYGFTDRDGNRPDWGSHLRKHFQNVPGSQIFGLSHIPEYEGFFRR